jgi:hypothetical protein
MKTITRTYQTASTSETDYIHHTPETTSEPKTETMEEAQEDIHEPEKHKLSFRSFLKMLVDHFTNDSLTAYTFYY